MERWGESERRPKRENNDQNKQYEKLFLMKREGISGEVRTERALADPLLYLTFASWERQAKDK